MAGCCFHWGCKSGYNGSKSHLFRLSSKASEEVRQAWLRNIPKFNGRTFDPLKSRLCYKHFEERFLVKTSVVRMGEQVVLEQERRNWTLSPEAVPTIFANHLVPAYYDRKAPTRMAPSQRKVTQKNRKRKTEEPEQDKEKEEEALSPWALINEALPALALPSEDWKVYAGAHRDRIHVTHMDFTNPTLPLVAKHIQLLNDMSFKVYASGVDITNKVSLEGCSVERVQELIAEVHKLKVCLGMEGFEMLTEEMIISGFKKCNRWFSNKCQITSHTPICTHCTALQPNLRKARKKFDLREVMASRVNL